MPKKVAAKTRVAKSATRSAQTRVVKGLRSVPSPNIQGWYSMRMRVLERAMEVRTERALLKKQALGIIDVYEVRRLRAKFYDVFSKESRKIAANFVSKNLNYTKTSFRAAVKPLEKHLEKVPNIKRKKYRVDLKIDGRKNRLELSQYKNAIEENTNLIKTIPEKYFGRVEKAVSERMRGKITRGALIKRLQEIGDISKRRAEMIADDQTAKVNERMMIERCRNNGIRLVQWVHSGLSEKPREYHKTPWDGHTGKRNGRPNGLNGFIFDIDNPPVIDLKTGERGYPAQLPNCKCYIRPVVKI